VIREPERISASDHDHAEDRAEMMRLRRGKSLAWARRPTSLSETMQPFSTMAA
jgi:hypothetical protein